MPESDVPVYQIVDGKLVRKPGDRRDPNRRYSHVVTPEGSYLREFTDKEERLRDEEEAKWEAGRPKREAEAKRLEEEATRFQASLMYELRFALFLDILGWTAAVRASTSVPALAQKLGLALNVLRQQTKMAEWMQEHGGDSTWPGNPQITHFSDCIVASANTDLMGRDWLVSTLGFLTRVLVQQGFLLRGGFTVGPLYHKDAIVFGPAFLRAYELEQLAVHPRVILEPELAAMWGQGDRYLDKDGSEIGRSKTWRFTSDGIAFFDFLQPFPAIPGHAPSSELLQRTLGPTRDTIVSTLRAHATNERVKPKYVWLAEYFNDVLSEYTGHGIEAIDLNAI